MYFEVLCAGYQTSAHDAKIEKHASGKRMAPVDRGDPDVKEYV